ncbi:MAG: hypothetical protein ACR2GN_05695 [Bacteroidia bacterium]
MSNIKLFESKRVRTHWDEEKETWYFSVINVIEILTRELIYIFLSALAILLIVNILLALKAGRKESGNELNNVLENALAFLARHSNLLSDN